MPKVTVKKLVACKTSYDRLYTSLRLPASVALTVILALGTAEADEGSETGSNDLPVSAQEDTTSDVTELPPITIRAERGTGPVSGVVAHVTATGAKTDTSIDEIPQSISVITRDQMNQQSVESVGESLRYTPGVFSDSRIGGVLESVFLRGFGGYGVSATNPQFLDGLPLMTGSGYAAQVIDPSTLERVEVLRGPASVLYGQATPGGIVNMVSKRPTDAPYHDIGLETGNRNRLQTSFDFGGPLGDGSAWSYRLSGLASRVDGQTDFSKQQRIVLAPTLSWQPNDNTSLTLFGFYQNDPDNDFAGWLPAQGTVLSNEYGRIPRDFFLGEPDYNDYSRQQYMIGYEFEHHFSDSWTVRQNLRLSHVDTSYKGIAGNYTAPFGETTADLNRLAIWDKERLDGIAVDNQVEHRASTGPLQHVLLGGLSYQKTVDDNRESSWGSVPSINYLSPIYGQSFDIPALSTNTRQTIDQIGVYLQDQIHVDHLIVTLGAREDWESADTDNRLTGARQSQDDHAFTGRIGAVYLFDNGLAPYASYSTSFQPTAGVDATGSGYKPSKARQVEVGLRYQPYEWNAAFTASLFDIHRTNVSVTDPDNPLYYIQTGKVRSRGVELEAKLGLTDNLDLIGAYTYLDTTVEKDTDSSIIGNRLVGVPKQMASLWLDYKITTGSLNGLSLGGGVRYIGKSAGDDANSFDVPAVTLFDAALNYDLGAAHPEYEGWHATVGVKNLFDKTYVASCFSTGGCFYGDGRTITASLHYQW